MHAHHQDMVSNRVGFAALQRRTAALREMTVAELREEYERVFDEPTSTRNRRYLIRRIAYRLQEQAYGGISQLAQERMEELARNAPIRRSMLTLMPELIESTTKPPSKEPEAPIAAPCRKQQDPRLPPPGTVLRKTFHDVEHSITVLDRGFEMSGKTYASLSSVARAITGTNWNGFQYFVHELKAARRQDA